MVVALKQIVGANVRAARLACGLTQEDLAERINRSTETVSNIERGKNPPSLETLCDIATVLNISLEALVTDSSPDAANPRLPFEAALGMLIRAMDISELPTALRLLEAFVQRDRRKG